MNLGWTFLNKDYFPLVKDFSCENQYISDYLRDPNFAINDSSLGETRTFLFLDKDNDNSLAGYSSIKCSSLRVEHEDYDGNLEIEVVPCIEIVMLARDISYQQMGAGEQILYFMINYINRELRPRVGIRAITLFSVPNKVGFYEKKEFRRLDKGMEMYVHPTCERCIPMFLALGRLDG